MIDGHLKLAAALAAISILSCVTTTSSATTITDSAQLPSNWSAGTIECRFGDTGCTEAQGTHNIGEFTISYAPNVWGNAPEDHAAGDGEDENWDWSFDFTNEPGYPVFYASTVLSSAYLTLTVTPSQQAATTNTESI